MSHRTFDRAPKDALDNAIESIAKLPDPIHRKIAMEFWNKGVNDVRVSLQARLDGNEDPGDTDIMALVDAIVKKESKNVR